MTYDEKLDIIIEAITDARKFTRKDYLTKLYYGTGNGIARVGLDEIYDILLQLQDDEKIIKVSSNRTSQGVILPSDEIKSGEKNYFLIEILDGYDAWLSAYLIKRRGKLENMSESNFNEIYYIIDNLYSQLQFSLSDEFVFSFVGSVREVQSFESEDFDSLVEGCIRVLEYLKKVDVIKEYEYKTMQLDARVKINTVNFFDLLERAKAIKQARTNESRPQLAQVKKPEHQLLYEPKTGILLINEKKTQFKKESFRAKLIELLLSSKASREKEWSWDEVIEKIEGTVPDGESKGKLYSACDGLSRHIAVKTGVNDLLIFNKSTVRINPTYS